jgi:hypothetical protein
MPCPPQPWSPDRQPALDEVASDRRRLDQARGQLFHRQSTTIAAVGVSLASERLVSNIRDALSVRWGRRAPPRATMTWASIAQSARRDSGRLSARFWFSQRTFPRACGCGRNAPKAAARRAAIWWRRSYIANSLSWGKCCGGDRRNVMMETSPRQLKRSGTSPTPRPKLV